MAAKRDPDRSAMALFADEMRAARDRAGLTQDELAARVNYSTTLVAMVESLKRVPQADLAARLDDVLGTPGTFGRLQERLRALPFPASFRPFAAYEDLAVGAAELRELPGTRPAADRGLRAGRPVRPAEHQRGRGGRTGRPSGWPGRRSCAAIEPPALTIVVDEDVLNCTISSTRPRTAGSGHWPTWQRDQTSPSKSSR